MKYAGSLSFLVLLMFGCTKHPSPEIGGFIPNLFGTVTDSCASSAPSNPSGISITTSNSPARVSVAWTNPANCNLKGVLVKRKTGSSPTGISDGTTIEVNSNYTSFDDNSVSASTLYYYKIFLYYNNDQYSSGTGIAALVGSTTIVPSAVSGGSITIDGQDSESVWSTSPKISFSFPVVPTFSDYTGGGDLNVTGYVRFAYDSDNFYIFYHSDDKYLRVDNSGSPWIDDGIEMFFDMGFNRTATTDSNDYHIIVTPRTGGGYENYGKGGPGWVAWTPAVTRANYTGSCTLNTDGDTDTGWNIEMKIPFTDLGIAGITPGQVIGFTFWVNDDDLAAFSGSQHWFRWTSGTLSTNPSTWGILQF